MNPINRFVPQIPPPIPSTKNRPPLDAKITTSPQPRAEGQNSRATASKTNAISYKQVAVGTTLANKCIGNLKSKAGLRTFNTNADALKATKDWQSHIALQVIRLNVNDQEKLASLSLYDLVDHDREVVGIILECLASSPDLSEATKQSLNSKVADLKTLIINIEEKEPDYKYLGGGAVNKVYRVTFYIDENGKQTTAGNGKKIIGVFKPDPAELDPATLLRESIWGTPKGSGIKPGDEAHMSARSVGSYALDKALYGDDPIGVKTEYIILNGKRGILMELAAGASPEPPKMEEREIPVSELRSKGIEDELAKKGLVDKQGKYLKGWNKIVEKTMGASGLRIEKENGKIFGTFPKFHVSKDYEIPIAHKSEEYQNVMGYIYEEGGYEKLTKDDRNFICQQLAKEYKLAVKDFKVEKGQLSLIILSETSINLENPVTAEGLQKLQVFDWISGQVDRHPENYYIDPKTGKVLAIDNDCAFGVDAVPKGIDVRSQGRLGGIVPNMGSLMLRMPTVVTESVKNDIMNLLNDPDKVKATLDQYISEEEKVATLQRLAMLAQHVNSRKCKIVANAEDLYAPENLLLQDSNNSLMLRERDRYRERKNWNKLRENEEKI